MNNINRKHGQVLLLGAALSLVATGCFGGKDWEEWEGETGDVGPDAAETPAFEIVSPAADSVLISAATVQLAFEEPADVQSDGYFWQLCDFLVDGELEQQAEFAFGEQGGWGDTSFVWDGSARVDGDYELSVVCGELEESVDVTLTSALIVSSVTITGDDGAFGGSTEVEVHLYDADSGAWLGCTHQEWSYAAAMRDASGEPFLLDALAGRSFYVSVIEDDDGAQCPAQPSVGNPTPLGDDDDLLGVSEAFTSSDLAAGVVVGGAVLALGHGS